MSISREVIRLSAEDLSDPVRGADRLNFVLAHISDRLDQLEALRGKAQVRGHLQIIDPDTGTVVGGFTDGST
jgi:hypothetical protein